MKSLVLSKIAFAIVSLLASSAMSADTEHPNAAPSQSEHYIRFGLDEDDNIYLVLHYHFAGLQKIDDIETTIKIPRARLPFQENATISYREGVQKISAIYKGGILSVNNTYVRKSLGKKYKKRRMQFDYAVRISPTLDHDAELINGKYANTPAR